MEPRTIAKPYQHRARKLFGARRAKKHAGMPEKVKHPTKSAPECTWHNWLTEKYPF
jgi:hypothetical protein